MPTLRAKSPRSTLSAATAAIAVRTVRTWPPLC
jgi:hypothetical protein